MNTEETTPVPNVIDRYEDEKPCDSRSWSCENPEHGRHRLFDAKRRTLPYLTMMDQHLVIILRSPTRPQLGSYAYLAVRG